MWPIPENNSIRKITQLGDVTTIAGNGVSGSQDGAVSVATFNYPQELLSMAVRFMLQILVTAKFGKLRPEASLVRSRVL